MTNNVSNLWRKQLDKSQIALIIVFVLAIASVAAVVYLYALPAQTELLDAKRMLEQRQTEYAAAGQQFTLERVDEEKIMEQLQHVPLSRLDSVYLKQLTETAEQHNLFLNTVSMSSSGGQIEGEAAGQGDMTKIFSLALSGRLPDVQQFMAELHAIEPLFVIKQWNISRADSASIARFYPQQTTDDEQLPLASRIIGVNMTVESYTAPRFSDLPGVVQEESDAVQ